jgi:hypothetical protein
MAGTVKLCVPEDVLGAELVTCADGVSCAELFELAGAAAECTSVGDAAGVGDDTGVAVRADEGDGPGEPAEAGADPLVAVTDESAEGFDPLVPQEARPAPPMTTAMITAGTRRSLMMQPLVK